MTQHNVTYAASLCQVCQHYDDGHIVLPDHPPEVIGRTLHGTLSSDVLSLAVEALLVQTHQISRPHMYTSRPHTSVELTRPCTLDTIICLHRRHIKTRLMATFQVNLSKPVPECLHTGFYRR